MFLRFSRKPSYKFAGKLRQVCAETGCTVPVIPEHIAKAEGLTIEPLDLDDSAWEAYGSNPTQIFGQTKGYVYLDKDKQHPTLPYTLVMSGSDQVLISWQLLMHWAVLSPTFPKIMDTNKLYRIHQGVTIEDAFVH